MTIEVSKYELEEIKHGLRCRLTDADKLSARSPLASEMVKQDTTELLNKLNRVTDGGFER